MAVVRPPVVGSFSGPHRSGIDTGPSNWDSASLELSGDGRFSLELWHFYESWDYIPEDLEDASNLASRAVPDEDPDAVGVCGVPLKRANHPREVEEVRVTLRGSFVTNEVVALRFRGFHHPALNQLYTEDVCQLVADVPTWWSEDGLHFFYFDPRHRVWRANSVRMAGGAGIRAVAPDGRRAGSGIAASGTVDEHESPVLALSREIGWHEVEGTGAWHSRPLQISAQHAHKFNLQGDDVAIEERHVRGDDKTVEEKHLSATAACQGWHQGRCLRLILPPLPDRIQAGDIDEEGQAQVVPACSSEPENGCNIFGDPDFLILQRPVSSKL